MKVTPGVVEGWLNRSRKFPRRGPEIDEPRSSMTLAGTRLTWRACAVDSARAEAKPAVCSEPRHPLNQPHGRERQARPALIRYPIRGVREPGRGDARIIDTAGDKAAWRSDLGQEALRGIDDASWHRYPSSSAKADVIQACCSKSAIWRLNSRNQRVNQTALQALSGAP